MEWLAVGSDICGKLCEFGFVQSWIFTAAHFASAKSLQEDSL
jgi:hypothetical protein